MYVIIGANGFLGSYFIRSILQTSGETILAVARHVGEDCGDRVKWIPCDITDLSAVQELNREWLQKSSGNRIIFLAACHHPDFVEKNPRFAWNVNITALSQFLNTADNVEVFCYPSTDSVYGESLNGYRFKEEDPLRPVNRYGLHKSIAERLVVGYGYHVVRYPFLIAPSLVPGRKHFYDQIAETIQNGRPMEMFADSLRSAISFGTAAELTLSLMQKAGSGVPQVINVCGDEALSKYEVGLRIADKLGVSRELIRPISVIGQKGIFEARRASSTLMDNTLLKQVLGLREIRLDLN